MKGSKSFMLLSFVHEHWPGRQLCHHYRTCVYLENLDRELPIRSARLGEEIYYFRGHINIGVPPYMPNGLGDLV